jgi:hypothetical protein
MQKSSSFHRSFVEHSQRGMVVVLRKSVYRLSIVKLAATYLV